MAVEGSDVRNAMAAPARHARHNILHCLCLDFTITKFPKFECPLHPGLLLRMPFGAVNLLELRVRRILKKLEVEAAQEKFTALPEDV